MVVVVSGSVPVPSAINKSLAIKPQTSTPDVCVQKDE